MLTSNCAAIVTSATLGVKIKQNSYEIGLGKSSLLLYGLF